MRSTATWVAAAILGLGSLPAQAQQRTTVDFNFEEQADGFGLGFVLGQPSGLSLAFRNGERSAVQAHVGWNVVNDWLNVSADYLHNVVLIESPEMPGVVFPLYVGIGGRVWTGNNWRFGGSSGVGLRVPFGIAMLPRSLAIDVFVEVVPVVVLVPRTDLTLDGGLGARLYF